MVTFPVATGARMLGIHPKTLHHWLKEANLPVAPHPTDARITCVAEEHLLEVARRHARPLPDLAEAPAAPEEQARPWPAHEARPAPAAALLSASSASPADLIQRLSCLETRIVTLQEQHAQLALALRRGARANGRGSHRSPGIPCASAGGKARASRTARARGRARVCLCVTSGASASAGRTTRPRSHAGSDRIRRTGNLCDHHLAGRRVALGARFGRVV
jgi:hypothetical protein